METLARNRLIRITKLQLKCKIEFSQNMYGPGITSRFPAKYLSTSLVETLRKMP